MKVTLLTKQQIFLTFALVTYNLTNCSNLFDFDDFNITTTQDDSSTRMSTDDFDKLVSDINPDDLSKIKACAPTEALSWLTFFSLYQIIPVLDEPLYLRTSTPPSRNLINYPFVQLCTYDDIAPQQFTLHLFYNQTSKKDFRNNDGDEDIIGTRIGSYFNIRCKSLGSALQNALPKLNIPNITFTLSKAHLEERRLGFMNHFYKEFKNKWYMEIKLPVFWMVRNLNFTQEEKDILNQELSEFAGTGFNEQEFAEQHIIMDAFGTGTMELFFAKKIWDNPTWSIDLGAGLLLPTDYRIWTGLYGTYFNPKNEHPILPLCDTVDLNTKTLKPGGKKILSDYFLGALNYASSILLQCQTGYEHHPGFVFKMVPWWQVRPTIEINAEYTLEVLLPHEEPRFFIPTEVVLFSEVYNAMPQDTQAQQQAKLLAVEKRITQIFYPQMHVVKIIPGVVFASTTCIKKHYNRWDFTAGYSGWYKSGEIMFKPDRYIQDKTLQPLDWCKGLTQDAYSVKLFGKIHRIFHTKRQGDFSLSFWGDCTVFNNGSGNDFTIGLSSDFKF